MVREVTLNLGIVWFTISVVPVLIFIRSLQSIRRCLNNPGARRRALVELPLVVLVSPLIITGAMLMEDKLDPEFGRRSFGMDVPIQPTELLLFAYDQAARGALFDVMEVFQVSLSPLQHQCNSLLFCTAVFLYRTSIGIAVSAFALALFTVLRSKASAEIQQIRAR